MKRTVTLDESAWAVLLSALLGAKHFGLQPTQWSPDLELALEAVRNGKKKRQ